MMARSLAGLSRRQWARMQRKVIAEHEQAVLSCLRQMAGTGHDVSVTVPTTGRSSDLGIVVFHAGDRRVIMAGVSVLSRARLATCGRDAWSIADAGRYGPLWWLRLTGSDHGGSAGNSRNVATSMTITASHVRIDPESGQDPGLLPTPTTGRQLSGGNG